TVARRQSRRRSQPSARRDHAAAAQSGGSRPTDHIHCAGGVVRLDASSNLLVDGWEFERSAAQPDPAAIADALAAYGGDVLTAQFAYDDSVENYRRRLRRTFSRLAATVLTDPQPQWHDDDLAALARRASSIAPDDDDVCVGVVRTLARLGHRAEAR